MADKPNQRGLAEFGQRTALAGLLLYVAFAPHSVAVSSIGIALASIGWFLRVIGGGGLQLRRSKFDLIILLSLLWTLISSLLSAEPAISIAKFKASWTVLIFYLTRAVLTKRWTYLLVAVLIASACTGTLYSLYDVARGRGVIVAALAEDSPFRTLDLRRDDTIWRVNGKRVYSTDDVDALLRSLPANSVVPVSVISQGEHVERQGLRVTADVQARPLASGIVSGGTSHRFRASGWTRHYETFAEVLQMIAQLALGLAVAHLRNHGPNKYFRFAMVATVIVALGIVLTAMRTVLIAFAAGAFLIAWRSTRGVGRVAVTFALFFLLAFGAVVVSQTRAPGALLLGDDSSSLRAQVAKVGLSRIMLHPVFGHGMDAMQKHWNEWGFPGKDMLHLHSTPLQLAFDRGLPMLALWVWLMTAFWLYMERAEKLARDRSDTNAYGVLLGVLGALTGFLISSLANYNYGDSEVVMLFWFLMGAAMVVNEQTAEQQR